MKKAFVAAAAALTIAVVTSGVALACSIPVELKEETAGDSGGIVEDFRRSRSAGRAGFRRFDFFNGLLGVAGPRSRKPFPPTPLHPWSGGCSNRALSARHTSRRRARGAVDPWPNPTRAS